MKSKSIAYLILAHADPKHLANLVTKLDVEADFYIHIDGKQNISAFIDYFKKKPNVFFITDRIRVSWGAFSQVRAMINLIKFSLDSRTTYQYFIFLSGADYPIKKTELLLDYLEQRYPLEHIRAFDMLNSPSNLKHITKYWFRENYLNNSTINKLLRYSLETTTAPISKSVLPEYKWCCGSAYWALTAPCLQYIINFLNHNPEYIRYHKYTLASDEHFFHTIVHSSIYAKYTLGLEDVNEKKSAVANLHFIPSNLSQILTLHDYYDLINSDKFFARKLDSEKSKSLIKKIDVNLLAHE